VSNVRPTISAYQEPEPGTPLEVGLGAFAKALLWGLLLVALVAGVTGVSISTDYLDQDPDRLVNNPPLRAWAGIWPIWRQAQHFPDVSPLTYTSFLVEGRMWNVNGPRSPAGFRAVNVITHMLAVLALWHLLKKLEIPGAWPAAAVFGVHPVNMASVGWISQRPVILGTLLALLTLVVLYRIMGLNPKPQETHRVFRLPDSRAVLWAGAMLLLTMTACASPAIAAMLGPVTLVVLWWERGKITKRDVLTIAPLLLVSLLVLAGALFLLLRRGVGDVALVDSPMWYRPIAMVHQIGFYAAMVVVPARLKFAYEPFGVFDAGAIVALVIAALVVVATVLAWRRYGRGPIAAVGIFVLLLLPSLVWVQTPELFGGWVGLSRLYPASAVIIVAVVTCVATWLQIQKDASIILAALAISAAGVGGIYQAWLHRSPARLWDNVLAQEPEHLAAGIRRADRLVEEKNYNSAETALNRLVIARPDKVEPLIELGELEEARQRFDRALATYLGALRIQPDNFLANFGLARCRAAMQDSNGALKQYEKVIQLRPADPILYNNVGLIYAERGQLALAKDNYEQALRLDPRCTAARINLANLLYQEGRVDDAARQLTTVVELDRDNFEAFMNAGAMLGQMRQFPKAAMLFRRAVTLKPEMAHAYGNLAMALLGQAQDPGVAPSEQLGLLGEAVFMFEKAAELDPLNDEFLKNARMVRAKRDAITLPTPN